MKAHTPGPYTVASRAYGSTIRSESEQIDVAWCGCASSRGYFIDEETAASNARRFASVDCLIELALAVEWVDGRCPCCFEPERYGHADDCRYKELRKAEVIE